MKALLVFVALSVTLTPHFLYSQNEIKNYQPPAVSKGTNLDLSFSSNFNSDKSSETGDKHSNLNLAFSGQYTNWKLTDRMNYAISANSEFLYNRSSYPDNESIESIIVNTTLNSYAILNAGISYYPFKSKFYGGLFLKSSGYFRNGIKPSLYTDIYPSIGYGRLVNAAELTDADNFEKVLIQQKVISKPLNAAAKKKLVELLDRKNNSEFSSMYKDDEDIEFYSEIEQLLVNEGIIKNQLGSRTVLKLFQTLTNPKFVFYPRYKGYQFQAEIDYYFMNRYSPSSYLRTVTLSAVYGLPVTGKLALLGSAFFLAPVKYAFLGNSDDFTLHSPISLTEYFQKPNYNFDLTPSFSGYQSGEQYSYKISAVLDAFYNISGTAGADFLSQVNLAKISNRNNDLVASFRIGASFNYNILSRMILSFRTYFNRTFYSGYNLFGQVGVSYNIF